MEAAHTLWRPLGRLLVAKGLVTEDQLEQALRDQALTGRRLGEILVDLGCLSRQALSLALAHQYGIEPPVETGFGTGLLAAIQLTQVAEPPKLTLVPPSPNSPAREGPAGLLPLAGMEEQWARLAAVEAQLAVAERANERRRRQVARLLARLRERDRPSERDAPDGHLLLVQLGDRYELVERAGPAPDPSATLELPELCEGKLVVAGLGRAPLPDDRRPCALAQRLHDAVD